MRRYFRNLTGENAASDKLLVSIRSDRQNIPDPKLVIGAQPTVDLCSLQLAGRHIKILLKVFHADDFDNLALASLR